MEIAINNTKRIYNSEEPIHKLFEKQVGRSGDNIAAVYLEQSITYNELNRKANQIAYILRAEGVTRNTIVGIMVHRSIDMLIGILGILKAGGCYLPVDPSYPESRINYLIEDSKTNIILTQENLSATIPIDLNFICLDDDKLYAENRGNIENINTSSDLAYVIYTSGSTGKPKGVMIGHKAVHNFIIGVTDMIEFSPDKSIICLTTISFDIFVLESLLPLLIGMKIVIADPMELSKYLNNVPVHMIQTTPSTMQLILNDESNLKHIKGLTEIMLGGEAFPKRLLQELKKYTAAKIYNMYGPTETTVWSAIEELTNSDEITIGKPIANTRIYIVDENNNPQSDNIVGELCIAGDGLAEGYLYRDELTNERFIENSAIPGEKIYKTGDMAKWLLNGKIDFIGRKDNQVKIRGFRIELGEIENCLNKYAKIKECVVAAKENNDGEKYLVAYYVSDDELIVSEIISFLSAKIPEYMIPGFYIKIEKMPLTPNFKIDRNALPEPGSRRPNLEVDYIAPNTDIENHIAGIWRQILKCQLIGVEDNFFDLGGNSVLVSHMHIELEKAYPGKVELVDIFAYPSISKLVKLIKKQDDEKLNFCKSIKTLKFPNEFYIGGSYHIDIATLEATINHHICVELKKLAETNNISLYNILLATYMYILSEALNQNDIEILAITEAGFQYHPININFTDFTDLIEMCQSIQSQIKDMPQIQRYTVDQLNRVIIKNNYFLPTFYFQQDRIQLEAKDIEFALHIRKHNGDLLVKIMFNAGILHKKNIEELMVNYIKLLNGIIENKD